MHDSTCTSTSHSTSEIVPLGKRTLGSLFKVHEDDMDLTTISTKQKIKAEVSKYIDEIRLDVEDDALKWWSVH